MFTGFGVDWYYSYEFAWLAICVIGASLLLVISCLVVVLTGVLRFGLACLLLFDGGFVIGFV